MLKNEYNLSNREERKELYYEYLVQRLPNVSFSEFEGNINFLCKNDLIRAPIISQNLIPEWYNLEQRAEMVAELVQKRKLAPGWLATRG